MNLKKLLAKGHLIPIYNPVGDNLCIVGYQRKASSRKSHQRPFVLKQPIPLGKIEPNPETKAPPENLPDNTEIEPPTE
tara:strand:+ start:3761 stop:3994 length:234 start_codon:yes stop_codon:yes gene_type:complete